MIKEEIQIPIYRGRLVMILTDDLTELNKEYNLNFTNSFGGGVFNITDEEGYTKFFVAFDNDWDNSLIAHEAVHLVNDIFKHKCIKLDPDNDEAQAYFTGWIFEKCEEFLIKHNGNRDI
jgi:hypothetical protein